MTISEGTPKIGACIARTLREVLAPTQFLLRPLASRMPESGAGTDPAKEALNASQLRIFGTVIMCVVSCSLFGIVRSAGAQTGQSTPTYYSIQHAEDWPPLPDNIWGFPEIDMGNGMIGIDDLDVDYDEMARLSKAGSTLDQGFYSLNEGLPEFPGEGEEGGEGGGSTFISRSYSTNELWLEILPSSTNGPGYATLVLHNTKSNHWYQILSSATLTNSPSRWSLGQILKDEWGTNSIVFEPVQMDREPMMFYRAVEGTNVVQAGWWWEHAVAVEPDTAASFAGQTGYVLAYLLEGQSGDVLVNYRMSGLAECGVDYTNTPAADSNSLGTFTISSFEGYGYVLIHPQEDAQIEFEESVILRLLPGPGYVVDPDRALGVVSVSDYALPTNLFTLVTNIIGPRGLDYDPLMTNLVVSYNWDYDGTPNNFGRIGVTNSGTNLLARFEPWSVVTNVPHEVNLTVVKSNVAGFVKGDVYFGGWLSFGGSIRGVVDKLAMDGTNWVQGWSVLTNEVVPFPDIGVAGGLCFDETGIFGNELIAVTGWDWVESGERGVWRINSNGVPTLLALIDAEHLEDVITFPDTPKWGPWAGKILTADKHDENRSFYTVDTNGDVLAYNTRSIFPNGISVEDFDVIRPNEDFYLCDPVFGGGAVMKLSRNWLTNYVGDLLVTESGEVPPFNCGVYIFHWDGEEFDVRRIPYHITDGGVPHLEHSSFAPIDIPSHAP